MVSFFKELEHPLEQYLPLVGYDNQIAIEIDPVPMEFFDKYNNLLLKLHNIDLLKSGNENHVYTHPRKVEKKTQEQLDWGDIEEPEIDYESLARYCVSNNYMLTPEEFMNVGFSYYGILKILSLLKEYEQAYIGKDYEDAYMKYLYAIFNQLDWDKKILCTDRSSLIRYIGSALTILKCQNRLDERLKEEATEAITYLEKLRVVLKEESESLIYYFLPDAWYITPFNHLYNSMGPNSHGEATLMTPIRDLKYGKEMYGHYGIRDYGAYLLSITDNIKDGYITGMEYFQFLHMCYGLPGLYDEKYYNMRMNDKLFYREFEIKTYSKSIVNIIVGIKSAQAGLYRFFKFLNKYSADYDADLEIIKKLTISDILVRCCGFHKISSVEDRFITTSCGNYEEEFAEYIERGWRIDYVKPYVLNPITKRLEILDEEIRITNEMHKLTRER